MHSINLTLLLGPMACDNNQGESSILILLTKSARFARTTHTYYNCGGHRLRTATLIQPYFDI